MLMNTKLSRRSFLKASAAGAAMASLSQLSITQAQAAESKPGGSRRRKFGQNDQINIAVIGPGGSKGGFKQGLHVTRACAGNPGVKVVAACDVDAVHLEEAGATFGSECRKYADFRELLGQKDIDAVVIGAPDHWHAYMVIAAMKAGKDVYCEKPLTLTIEEGRQIVRTWRNTGAVFQTGSQQRSEAGFRTACELIRNGRIGNIKRVEARLPGGTNGGPFPVEPVPGDLDWDMWLGPAPMRDYMKERTHGSFRWWLDYSGGTLTDWGAHHNDIAQWALGYDRSGPISVEGFGKGPDPIGPNCYNTFPEFDLDLTYDNGTVLHVTSKGENGVRFEGEDGWIFVARGKLEASDQKLIDEPLPSSATRLYESNNHAKDWIDCIRARKQPICDAEIGHRSVSICHLCNICLRLGGYKLQWDPEKERFKDSPEANALLTRPARKGWQV
ncbi:MAG: Gfo/Idh/MocA family oxidoreductase [Armatimonadetes bacterium]|nr:Gfo/Idh/MocA family oxidoreductase [Armatimonadota bacterium]